MGLVGARVVHLYGAARPDAEGVREMKIEGYCAKCKTGPAECYQHMSIDGDRLGPWRVCIGCALIHGVEWLREQYQNRGVPEEVEDDDTRPL